VSGIRRVVTPAPRPSLIERHLPGTAQVRRLLRKEGQAHGFNDRGTLERVVQAIIERGERTGEADETDDYERYGLYFSDAIG